MGKTWQQINPATYDFSRTFLQPAYFNSAVVSQGKSIS